MKFHLPSDCEGGILLFVADLNPALDLAVGCLSPWRLFSISKEW